MTRDEILAMEAGREMDALVAEKVMEWTRAEQPFISKWGTAYEWQSTGDDCPDSDLNTLFAPLPWSTDMAAAWEVVESFGPIPFLLAFHPADAWRGGSGEICCFSHWSCWFEGGGKIDAKTAPLAICRAALLAVMEADDA
jgi:hypothetical protein